MVQKENGIRRNASLKIIQKALRLMPHNKRSLKNTLSCEIASSAKVLWRSGLAMTIWVFCKGLNKIYFLLQRKMLKKSQNQWFEPQGKPWTLFRSKLRGIRSTNEIENLLVLAFAGRLFAGPFKPIHRRASA